MRSCEFSDVLLIRTLIEIKKNQSVGRKRLSDKIGISEGSMRALLNHLKQKEVLTATNMGHSITPKGNEIAAQFLKFCSFPFKISLPDMTKNKCIGIILKGASEKIKNGIEERDTAIREGCNGAYILLYAYNGFKFPSVNTSIFDYPVSHEFLNNMARQECLKEKDVAVICFADDFIKAENGVIKISLNIQNFKLEI
ncbi:MAG: hypothetical protein COV98_04170 [Candidatus Altarchaeum sp. CG12_big_fil_rev_8_21_14_0_65_33_22]|mgnify:CR=1 FL=1|nr:MAG: hypothetical protein AUK59_04075 [Candidatus Altarchaeum sp. CG2_30_32_3053]PIN67199.1 MAG: hypothetical protein COV98_04170 [Candidatus Altarchaeum sp. CG12_big_fil_rev_8_21_14_0_65_33_22]PIV27843.1 MAG: hypothetical protein COS36_04325 [Candidatus Altarchaeum sp. CG03_land_8_20_14_0_80_32_618]PIZ30996.1 MAG: hypothetical protein COY41_03160 [Candidatus Altarchaeum sp. CG_4_10_14_0_8_um_filter_32_851]